MRAVLCREWGDVSSLTVDDVQPSTHAPGEVRIAVHACGVNFADTLIIAGKYQVKPEFPFSPGLEVAGTVLDCGAAVTRCRPGDRVVAALDHGGFAEQAVAREEDVFLIPDEMDFVTAAGFPIAYGTADGAYAWRAGLRPGEVVLVHGAAGGVGLTGVEVAKAMGATVIGTARGREKLDIAAAHGADHVIDYADEDIRARVKELTDGRGADVIYDPVGGDVFDTSLRCINWSGRIVVVGFAGGRVPQIPANILLVKNVAVFGFNWGSYRRHDAAAVRDSFARLFGWWRDGRLKPHVSHRFDLSDYAAALEMLLARKSTGKVVLTTGRGEM